MDDDTLPVRASAVATPSGQACHQSKGHSADTRRAASEPGIQQQTGHPSVSAPSPRCLISQDYSGKNPVFAGQERPLSDESLPWCTSADPPQVKRRKTLVPFFTSPGVVDAEDTAGRTLASRWHRGPESNFHSVARRSLWAVLLGHLEDCVTGTRERLRQS
jgi:hypothetical protein